MIRALVFDLDDTLIMEEEFVRSGYHALDQFIVKDYNKRGFYQEASTLFDMGERHKVFNRSLQTLNIPFNDELIDKMIHIYRSHSPNIKLLADARWILDRISATIKLGLISDGYLISQQNKVKALNLQERFQTIILSDSFGRENWKPSPLPYREAAQALASNPNECVYIGDNVAKDFITANELGWLTIHINRQNGIYQNDDGSDQHQARYQISNLKELINIPELTHCFDTKEEVV